MELSKNVRGHVASISLTYLGKKQSADFSCITYVREVHREVGIEVPVIDPYLPPPAAFNITERSLEAWEPGYIVFLMRRGYVGRRTWTHVGITLPDCRFIHSSEYFDGEVSVNSKEEIFAFYHHVPNGPLT